jgi:transposase
VRWRPLRWLPNTLGTCRPIGKAQMPAAQGIDIKRAVLAFEVGHAAELKPAYLRPRDLILTSAKIAVDETKAQVPDPGRGRTKRGYFWAVTRDDRP